MADKERMAGGKVPISTDEMRDAVSKVKAGAAAMTALYVQDVGHIMYETELLEVISDQLHEAARYLDGVLDALGEYRETAYDALREYGETE